MKPSNQSPTPAQVESSDDKEDAELLRKGESAFSKIRLFAIGIAALYLINFLTWAILGFFLQPDIIESINSTSDLRDTATWGQIGDFFGGIINPAIGFATVYLILVNVRMQRKELRYALAEMKDSNRALTQQNLSIEQQGNQSIFFSWLSTYKEIVAGTSSELSAHSNMLGQNIFSKIYEDHISSSRILGDFHIELGEHTDDFLNYRQIEDVLISRTISETILNRWRKYFEIHRNIIGPGMKSLLGLLLWIHRQPERVMTKDLLLEYTSILSSQLSEVELKFLFYYTNEIDPPFLKVLIKLGLFHDLLNTDDKSIRFIINHDLRY